MTLMNVLLRCVLLAATWTLASAAHADSVPELFHYRFDDNSLTVPNLASSPPPGTATAALMGGHTLDGPDLNFAGTGHSIAGSGQSASTDYLNTNWATELLGSWTISFATQNITASSTLFYVFGDINAGSIRCFTNGVAGPNNWILRGPFNDVLVNGGATEALHRTTFVYDSAASEIRAYLDGVLVNTVAQTPIAIVGAGPFKVAGYGTNVGLPSGGNLDDFRIYNRALSAEEVAAIDTKAIIEVSGNATTIANGDTTPDPADDTDFGDVVPGNAVSHTFTITNNGNAALDVADITLTGAAAADFTVTAAPGSSILPAGSATFDVQFAPSSPGLREATVTLASNADDDPSYTFAIAGNGFGPRIEVSGNGAPIASGDVTPDPADGTEFGDIALGTSATQGFLIANTGGLTLDIGSIELSGAGSEAFVLVGPVSGAIPPGESAGFAIRFEPGSIGAQGAQVSIASNAPEHPLFTFVVGGNGTAAAIDVQGNGLPIANGDTTPSVDDGTDFGTIPLDGSTVTRPFDILSAGNLPLSITDVSVGGAASSDFSITSNPVGSELPPSGTAVLEIQFLPTAPGPRTATVTITTNAFSQPSFTFDITGNGEAADVQVSKTNFQPHLQAGVDTVYTIQVLNAGPAAVSAVRVVDTLPANLVDGAWQCVSVPAGLCPNASGGPDIDETVGPLPSGAVLEYSLIATPAGVPSDFVSNTAAAENLDGSDPDLQNNSATDTDPIVPDGIFRDGFESSGKHLLVPRIGS